ncbi:hypothetical protein [Streptomyces sp. NBC_00582]|uniref:hypothetical protein n=1 Tax=Streptomyces sp. NBC_00582 TaxID=2975783 RepID=UPI0010ED3D0B|nr:hypothetical protein [Streptomyces sp. NBC_00582]WUB68283.1 hypothetical protein OG852_44045 [Streptomyces sp. NBC_00582]
MSAEGEPTVITHAEGGRSTSSVVAFTKSGQVLFQRRTVYCPPGKKVIGGGAEAQGNGAILVGGFPTPDSTGWIALGRQDGYASVGISVYAICANA